MTEQPPSQPDIDMAVALAPPVLPAFLKLVGRKVVLVGGGPVAAAKLTALVDAKADVTIVAPALVPALRQAATAAGAHIVERGFEPEDLGGAWYVVAAAPPEVNRQVLAAAEPRCLFVNAVDDPPAATAYAGGIVRRGPVTLAISTGGVAPALAGLLREALAAVLPDDLERWAEVARAARAAWKRDGLPMAARRPFLLAALNQLYADDARGDDAQAEVRP